MNDKELLAQIKEIIQQYEEGLIADFEAVMKIFEFSKDYLES